MTEEAPFAEGDRVESKANGTKGTCVSGERGRGDRTRFYAGSKGWSVRVRWDDGSEYNVPVPALRHVDDLAEELGDAADCEQTAHRDDMPEGRPITMQDQMGEARYLEEQAGEAMRDRLDDLALLVSIANGEYETSVPLLKHAEALGLDPAVVGAHPGWDNSAPRGAVEEAGRLLSEAPLAVEATITFEVVLGMNGPDDRLLFACDIVGDARGGMPSVEEDAYEIRRVIYRYSQGGSVEVELVGEDRETAEALARRVVPELAD